MNTRKRTRYCSHPSRALLRRQARGAGQRGFIDLLSSSTPARCQQIMCRSRKLRFKKLAISAVNHSVKAHLYTATEPLRLLSQERAKTTNGALSPTRISRSSQSLNRFLSDNQALATKLATMTSPTRSKNNDTSHGTGHVDTLHAERPYPSMHKHTPYENHPSSHRRGSRLT